MSKKILSDLVVLKKMWDGWIMRSTKSDETLFFSNKELYDLGFIEKWEEPKESDPGLPIPILVPGLVEPKRKLSRADESKDWRLDNRYLPSGETNSVDLKEVSSEKIISLPSLLSLNEEKE